MPAFRWKKYCRQCGYSLDELPERECPECGQAFDPDDEATWSKRPYDLEKVKKRRRKIIWIAAVALAMLGHGLAAAFPPHIPIILLLTCWPLVLLWIAWGLGVDLIGTVWQTLSPLEDPVKEAVEIDDAALEHLVGKQGQVTVTLKPVGRIMIDGCEYEAKSEIELEDIGQHVKVTDTDKWLLIVRGVDG